MTIYALRHSLSGDPEAMLFLQQASERQDSMVGDIDSAWISAMQPGQDELSLRSRVEESDRFALQRRPLERESATTGFPFLPLVGGVSSGLDLGIGHLGVDLVAPEGSAIQAVDDGSVLFSSYTIETGYTLVLQHRSDRVSVYKHCASLLKRQGDLVAGGEAIALMGNTGDLTTGPHLHFEWWVRGRPTDRAHGSAARRELQIGCLISALLRPTIGPQAVISLYAFIRVSMSDTVRAFNRLCRTPRT